MSIAKILSGRKASSVNQISELTAKIGQVSASRSLNDEKIGQFAIATESLGPNEEQLLTSVYNNIESSIRTIVQDFGISLEDYQIEAGAMAGIYATNPKSFLSSKLKPVSSDSVVINTSIANSFIERPQLAMEAYDERENRNAHVFSIVYNMLAARQNEFGETFFPTILINPTEVGITLQLRIYYVYNDFKRTVSGALANYGRKNIIRAYADHEVLKNELTKAVPVIRTGGGADDNSALFASEVPTWSVNLGSDINVTTGALKPDNKIDLIALSQTNELLNSGLMGPSDNLDTFIKLDSIYVKFTDGTDTDIVRINLDSTPDSTFTFAPQGNYRRMILAMDNDTVVLDDKTRNLTGVAPVLLPELATSKARIQLSINGSVILDKGDTIVNRGSLALTTLRNAAGQLVGGAAFDTLAAKIAAGEIIGYTLNAYRANGNIRQRGQLLDSQTEYRVINVPYRTPLSAIMPVVNPAEDTSALQTLINTTGARISNDAVATLVRIDNQLSTYNGVADAAGELPPLFSIGHYYVKPVYFSEAVDLGSTVDSTKSHERIQDIRSAIVEKIRYYANEMYRLSEYRAAAAVLTGNIGFKPTVIVGTDPTIYNYIQFDGELRTLGESFDVKVVSTIDLRISDKIFISFGVFDAARNTAVNPLNFGCLLYSPEITTKIPVSRDGSVSNELLVTPRYAHIEVLPVLTTLTVTGLPTVTNKVVAKFNGV